MSTEQRDAAREAIDSYRAAIRSEVEFSMFWGRYFGIRDSLLDVPNGFTKRSMLLRFARVSRALILALRPLWVFVLMPTLALFWALRWSLGSGWGRVVTPPPSIYLHASNDRNMSFVPPDAGRPTAAITLPWRHQQVPCVWAHSCIDLRDISTRANVWRAAWWSLLAGVDVWRSAERSAVLFTYSAPAWFWTYIALRNAPLEAVWVSNHVDRWASLATSLPGVRVTMVQHGDLGHRDLKSGERLVPRLGRLLQGVERVFVTDDGSVADFVAAVTGAGPVFLRIDLGMRLEPSSGDTDNVRRILIIGHPDAQAAIGRLIRDVEARVGSAVGFAYRPHPTESRPIVLPHVTADRVVVTGSGDTVPAADVVVSYGSSVTGEILAATGAQLVHWDPNDADSARTAVDAVVVSVTAGSRSPTTLHA